tara:strand:- start:244927 stop:245319 length:393 start_codon:yes stop_codon:yes gene_type:complete
VKAARRSEEGFSLIEALVAVTILSLAVAGASSAVTNGLSRQTQIKQEAAALSVLRHRFELGMVAEGREPLEPFDIEAVWRVRREEVGPGQLAGVEVKWVDITAEIVWFWQGQERRIVLDRTDVVPMTALP